MGLSAFLVAGEPSGDRLGSALMAGLKSEVPGVSFAGVGGPLMQAEGMVSQFDMTELSLMGIAEILPKYFHLKRRIAEVADAVIAAKPDVLITIDSPDFCLRVARRVKEAGAGVRCVHYVAPSVWAWRPGRAVKMARWIDQVLALLPFEPPLMEAAGMACDFVGHPAVSEPVATEAEAQAFRARHDIGDAPMLLVLPGSRRSEVTRLGPVFGAAAQKVVAARPDLRVVVPAAASVAALVLEQTSHWAGTPVVLDPASEAHAVQKRAAFKAADCALAASGTVSLELAAASTPMVIAYDMNWLSRAIIGRMVKIDTVTLVNLVSQTRAVPEFIGKRCQPDLIATGVSDVLRDPHSQYAAMTQTMERLGLGGDPPGLRAARAVLAGL